MYLQNTYETPFLSIFVIIFGAHSFLKFLNLALHHIGTNALVAGFKLAVLCLDILSFMAVLELAVCSGARARASTRAPPPVCFSSLRSAVSSSYWLPLNETTKSFEMLVMYK